MIHYDVLDIPQIINPKVKKGDMIEKFLSFINNYLVIYVKVLPYCLNFLYKHFIKYSFLLNILLILENIAHFASK